jgi:AbrB family looped-hinge helix DNA binding protein
MGGREIHTHQLKVDSAGRVVLPADFRQRVAISPGDHVVAEDDGTAIRIRTYDQVVKDVQAFFKTAAPKDRLLSEELIRERRAEAAREAND